MEENEYLIILYDYYGELLNELQRNYFELYYFDNLSLSEISENLGVSRNAIHKSLKSIESLLLDYEDKLKIYDKTKKMGLGTRSHVEKALTEVKKMFAGSENILKYVDFLWQVEYNLNTSYINYKCPKVIYERERKNEN